MQTGKIAPQRPQSKRPPHKARATRGSAGPLLAALLLVAVIAIAWKVVGLKWLAAAYGLMSLVSLVAYKLDKSRAERSISRTPENTLLAFDFACGWPGGLLAQQLFRHKNRKTSYQIKFWLVAAANVAALAYAHSKGLLQGLIPS